MSRAKPLAWRLSLLFGLALTGGYFLLPRGKPPQNALYDILSMAAVVAILVGVRLHRPPRRLPWYLIAGGQLLFTVGDLTWDYYEFLRHVSAPFPSVADVFYLAGYPFLALGLVLLVRGREPRHDWGGLIDATIIATGLGVLSWVFFMLPYAKDPSLSGMEKAVSIAYPLMDVLVLAVVARLLVGTGPRAPAFWYLAASLGCVLVADSIYAQTALAGSYLDGDVLDLGWLLSFVLLGVAALHPSMRDLSVRFSDQVRRLTRRRLALLTVASLMAPAALAIQSLRGEHHGEDIIAFGSAVLFVLVLVRLAGLTRSVEANAEALRDQGSRLSETEARYRTVVEHIPAITFLQHVWPGDPDSWQTLYISPQVETLLGFTPEEWIRVRPWISLLHPDDRDRIVEADDRRLATGAPFREEYRLNRADGRTVWVHEETLLLQAVSGQPMVWQGVMFDITAHKLAEDALRRALGRERDAATRLRGLDDMKNMFLVAVSHELRTPLSAILGTALTLDRDELDLSPEDSRDLVRRLASNARKLDRLLGDLLDLDRLDRGIIEPKRHPTDVGALVRRVVEEMEALKGREVEIDAPQTEVEVDPAKVERIIENLLLNTIRHTPASTRVWIRVASSPEGVLLVVEDAGPGVPADLREHVFEPFQQGPNSIRHSPGVGIGLSLVARFAELHGGRAWVEDRPGGGASFRVVLPGRHIERTGADALVARR